jgi:predicted ATPase/class 3 adenylate cyclase
MSLEKRLAHGLRSADDLRVRSELPTGTVTFVFTDVDGSTSLLNALGAQHYADELAAHRTAIRAACTDNGGVEVDTQGDAFFFAFATAPGALTAASDFTERLAANGPVRVRVGIHTGTPFLGDEGYVGHDVHRAARIAAAGHGGQVLVSASTASLVDTELTDLGEHRFKDLAAPERVFQLGDGEFPSLKSLYRTNLPIPATAFLGRERELREVGELLDREDARLVTLTGPGGTGKTRLMLQAAADASDGFSDGVHWIPLAPVRDEASVGATFALALEVRDLPGIDVGTSIISTVGTKRSLIVVDNCEHLVGGVAELVGQLVGGCPEVVVVASSRERLGLQAERIYEVPPMAISDGHALFVERASAVRTGFQADEQVDAICDAVDHLPLAIELAAARVRALSTSAIHERLGERLALLASRNRDVEERQRTLEATIAWSYDLLDDDERRVLRGVSVFAGGCTLAAAEAVADAGVDSLESLLDKSLLRHRIGMTGEDRYWMLETIREYAQRELEREGEADGARTRHSAFFADLADRLEATDTLAVSDEQRALVVSERANFDEAHARALATGDGATALRFVRRLGPVMSAIGGGARDWHARAVASLALTGGTRQDRAYALVRTARVASLMGEFERARSWLDEADALFEALGDRNGSAAAIWARCDVEGRTGNYDKVIKLAEWLAVLRQSLDDADPAAVAARTRTPSEAELALAWALLGRAVEENDREAAERSRVILAAGADAVATSGTLMEQASWVGDLALSLFVLEDYSESIATAQRALGKLRELEARDATQIGVVWDCLFTIGLSQCGRGEAAGSGISLVSAARRVWHVSGVAVAEEPFAQALLGRVEKGARASLGDEGYETAVRKGEAMARDEAIELALSITAD